MQVAYNIVLLDINVIRCFTEKSKSGAITKQKGI